jgi:hypothetical protein
VSFATSTITLNGGDTIPTDAVIRILAYKTSAPSSTFPSLVDANRGTVAYYLKAWQTNIYLDVASVSSPAISERLLKVQSADWSIDFKLQQLFQIAQNSAGSASYCRVPQTPFDVTLNLSVYSSDYNEWLRILKRGTTNPKYPSSGNTVYTDHKDFEPNNLLGDRSNPLTAVIRSYTKAGNVLQTIQFHDLRIDSFGDRVSVGGREEVSLGLKGTRFSIVGVDATS